MDNMITGLLSVVTFLAFTLGLAVSISTIPFAVIVIIVCSMLLIDFYQSAKEGLKAEKNRNSEPPQNTPAE